MVNNDTLEKDLNKKRLELEGLYLKKMRQELKETHLIGVCKKEVARLYTKLNARGE
ncbi:MAG: 50S ribosomal protein L29 [Candidatus Margulisiibacteriota bacterium]|jgi:ribosomal protein L29